MLVLGVSKDVEDSWRKWQIYTLEDLYNFEHQWSESCVYKNQEECDKASTGMRLLAQSRLKYQGQFVKLDRIKEPVEIFCEICDSFDMALTLAKPVTISSRDLMYLEIELRNDGWVDFDIDDDGWR